MFTQDTTIGYTDDELRALGRRLAAIDADDIEARQRAEKAFYDEVSGYEALRAATEAAKERWHSTPSNGLRAQSAEWHAARAEYFECVDRLVAVEKALG